MLVPMKDQVIIFWNKQTKPQRFTIAALVAAALILIPVLLLWAGKPTYSVAYHGLSDTDAAAITQKLDEDKIPYTLQDDGTILVPSDQVYAALTEAASPH